MSANYFNRLGSFERCSYKIFNWQVEDSWGILCILHVLNVQCALLQLYIYSHYGVINEQVMPPERRHEYGRMGAVCRRSRGMGNEKVKMFTDRGIFVLKFYFICIKLSWRLYLKFLSRLFLTFSQLPVEYHSNNIIIDSTV